MDELEMDLQRFASFSELTFHRETGGPATRYRCPVEDDITLDIVARAGQGSGGDNEACVRIEIALANGAAPIFTGAQIAIEDGWPKKTREEVRRASGWVDRVPRCPEHGVPLRLSEGETRPRYTCSAESCDVTRSLGSVLNHSGESGEDI